MRIRLEFDPWKPFFARKRKDVIRNWLERVAKASESAFKGGMRGYPPSSVSGQYPSIRTGRLRASIDTKVSAMEMTIGSNAPAGRGGLSYSVYLREGTAPMGGRRKMSDDALKEGIQNTGRLGQWVRWSYS